MTRFLPLLAVALFVLPVSAHEGEDHGAPVAATLTVGGIGPRAETATELFELVAVASGDHLTMYVDRFATNEPLSNAKIEVEGGGLQATAEELEAGVYQVVASGLAQAGPHVLAIGVQVGDDVDLLSLTVEGSARTADAPGVAPADSADQRWSNPFVWGASGAVLLIGAGVIALRRRSAGSGPGKE